MPKIVPIVEGDGEVDAVPVLLYKILNEMERWDIQIAPVKNAHGCANLTKPEGLEKYIRLAWKEPDCAGVLVLMDADEACPRTLANDFVKRIEAMGVRHSVAIVFAKCEYEVWFLASLETIAGKDWHTSKDLPEGKGLPTGLTYTGGIEAKRGVKEWLSQQMPRELDYKPSEDQLPMTQLLDTTLARTNSRSFRRLWHAMEELLAAADDGEKVITPPASR